MVRRLLLQRAREKVKRRRLSPRKRRQLSNTTKMVGYMELYCHVEMPKCHFWVMLPIILIIIIVTRNEEAES